MSNLLTTYHPHLPVPVSTYPGFLTYIQIQYIASSSYRYLEVYEATLTDYLVTLDKGVEEFYAEVRESQDDSMDPYLKTFVDCLLASADYESFYKVMIREGKKKATQLKKEALKAEVKEGVQPSPSQGAPEWDSGNGNPSDSKGLSLEQPDEKASSPHRGGSSSDYGADAKDAASSPGRDEKGQDDYK